MNIQDIQEALRSIANMQDDLKKIGKEVKEYLDQNESKEIRPEKAGELWQQGDGEGGEDYHYYFTFEKSGMLKFRSERVHEISDWPGMIHGKNGWTRLYPPVEDDSVEIIEFEGVVCKEDSECVYTIETTFTTPQDLANKPMKMTLEFKKDKHES